MLKLSVCIFPVILTPPPFPVSTFNPPIGESPIRRLHKVLQIKLSGNSDVLVFEWDFVNCVKSFLSLPYFSRID